MTINSERYALWDVAGNELFNNVPVTCRSCLSCASESELIECKTGENKQPRRRGKKKTDFGTFYFCTDNKDLRSSSKRFRRESEAFSMALLRLQTTKAEIARSEAQKAHRLFHNLISINGKSTLELYSVVSQSELAFCNGFESQLNLVKSKLKENDVTAAKLFLRILKLQTAVKAELSAYRKLNDPAPVLEFKPHPIHKLLKNSGSLFFQDLTDAGIELVINSTNRKIISDYDSMQVIIYHLFDNAVKYCKPNTRITINFLENDEFVVVFNMTSLYVPKEERTQINEEGFSGLQAQRLGKAGDGIGMSLVNALLKINGGRCEMKFGELLPSLLKYEPNFASNRIELAFLKTKVTF